MSQRQIFAQVLTSAMRAAIEDYAARSGRSIDEIESIVRAESNRALERIRAKWPVDTGFSQSMFQVARTGRLGFTIVNRAIYSGWVHRKGESTPLADTLIPSEVAAARRRIMTRIQPTAAQIAGAGLGAFAARAAFRAAARSAMGRRDDGRPSRGIVASAIARGARSLLTSQILRMIRGS